MLRHPKSMRHPLLRFQGNPAALKILVSSEGVASIDRRWMERFVLLHVCDSKAYLHWYAIWGATFV